MLSSLMPALKRFTESVFLEKIFPNEFIEDDMLIRPDGNISVGFEVVYPLHELSSENELVQMEEKMEEVLSRLPEGTSVHFQTIYFHTDSALKAYQESVQYLTGKIRDYHSVSPILDTRSYCWLSFNVMKTDRKNPMSTFFSTFSSALSNPLQQVEKNKAIVRNMVQSFLSNAKSINSIEFRQLTTNGIKAARMRYLNLDFNKKVSHLSGDFTNLKNRILVGDQVAQFVYMGRSSHQLYRTHINDRGLHTFMPWTMGHYLNFPHVVNLSMIIGGEEDLRKLDTERKMRQSLGSMQKQIDRAIIDDIDEFTSGIRAKNKSIVLMNHNVMVWGDDESRVSINADLVKSAYIRMNGSYGISDSSNAGNYFFVFSPGYALDSFYNLRMSLEDAILHFDYSQPTKSENRGHILCNREQEPVLVDMYSDRLPNKNRVVIGPSGSGKSFFMNTINSQSIEQGIDTIIIDVGDKAGSSYQNILSFFKGDYMRLSEENPFNTNAFIIPQNKSGHYELTADKKVFLLSLLTILWKEEGQGLSKEEEAILSDLLLDYYKQVNDNQEVPVLDKFVEYLNKRVTSKTHESDYRFFNIDSFNLVIKKFIGKGPYAKVLNSDKVRQLADNRLICFDLFGVKSDPVLFPVISLLIIETIMDKIRNEPHRKKEVIIDEAWSILSSGALGEFINVLYRTIRKSNGAVTLISQGITELVNSPVGAIVSNNSATVVLLDHNSVPKAIPMVREYFAMTDSQVDLLKSVRKGENWREFLLLRSGVAQIFSVNVGPHATAAFSTKPEDRVEIERLTKLGGTQYAINQFVENMDL